MMNSIPMSEFHCVGLQQGCHNIEGDETQT